MLYGFTGVLAIVFALYLILEIGILFLATPTVVEWKNVQLRRVVEHDGDHGLKLRVSGLAVNSALSISKIETRWESTSSLVLLVDLGVDLYSSTSSKYFDYDVSISSAITEVRFGKDRAVIWHRAP